MDGPKDFPQAFSIPLRAELPALLCRGIGVQAVPPLELDQGGRLPAVAFAFLSNAEPADLLTMVVMLPVDDLLGLERKFSRVVRQAIAMATTDGERPS